MDSIRKDPFRKNSFVVIPMNLEDMYTPRRPLHRIVPLRETTVALEAYRPMREYEYEKMMRAVLSMTRDVFNKDIGYCFYLSVCRYASLVFLGAVERRLNGIYTDALNFKIVSAHWREMGKPPVMKFLSQINSTEKIATETGKLSREVGEGMDIEVTFQGEPDYSLLTHELF